MVWVVMVLIVLVVVVLLTSGGKQNKNAGVFGLFPSGTNTGTTPTTPNDTNNENTGGEQNNGQAPTTTAPMDLVQLSSEPIGGAVFLGDASTTVRYIERATGHVYDVSLSGGEKTRVSNTTIPKVANVLWGKDAKQLIIQYLSDDATTIKSFYAQIKSGETTGSYLEDNITLPVVSPDRAKIYYSGTMANFGGGGKAQITNIAPDNWLAQWVKPDTIALNSRPSANINGYLFLLNIKTGSLTKILSGLGLTSLFNNNLSRVLYAEGLSLNVYDIGSKQSSNTPLKTLPEKCVWGTSNTAYCAVPKSTPRADYPDAWYQGRVSFNDELWKINTDSGNQDVVRGVNVDAINLMIDQKENYIIFTNKSDLTLWVLRIK